MKHLKLRFGTIEGGALDEVRAEAENERQGLPLPLRLPARGRVCCILLTPAWRGAEGGDRLRDFGFQPENAPMPPASPASPPSASSSCGRRLRTRAVRPPSFTAELDALREGTGGPAQLLLLAAFREARRTTCAALPP